MNAKLAVTTRVFLLLTSVPALRSAQDKPANPSPQTLTGCLQRGEAVTAYKLVSKDGTWDLGGAKNLKLSAQVDHTVTVRGKVVEASVAKPKGAENEKRDPKEKGIFQVSKVRTVKTSCSADE